jgi:hypothetical protein
MSYLQKIKNLKPATDKSDEIQKSLENGILSVSSLPDLAVAKMKSTFVGFVGDRSDDYIFGDPHQSAVTWRLTFADPSCKITHFVCSPATSRAAVFARFAPEGLLGCEPDQNCKTCGWRIGHALAGSPIWCSNPGLKNSLKPVYGVHHPARSPPSNLGASCEHHTTKP